jgi:RimJ/RimL family protein N-acetyltransferase
MTVLEGAHVRLEPLTMAHADALLAAASEDRSSYAYSRVPQGPDGVVAFIDDALAWQRDGRRIPFATRWLDGDRIVGSTSFFPEEWPWSEGSGHPDAVEIGFTWLAASAQRTPVNTEAKLLMMTHAFEVWHVRRLFLKTDARNVRSRAAIERLGAMFEGVLRQHMPAHGPGGGVRDSAFYSVLPAEWPAVKAGLRSKLGVASGIRRRAPTVE